MWVRQNQDQLPTPNRQQVRQATELQQIPFRWRIVQHARLQWPENRQDKHAQISRWVPPGCPEISVKFPIDFLNISMKFLRNFLKISWELVNGSGH